MFFSLLYIFTLGALVVITTFAVRAIVKNAPVRKWIMSLLCVTFVYLLSVALSTCFNP